MMRLNASTHSVCLIVCLSVCLSVRLSVCLSFPVSLCPSVLFVSQRVRGLNMQLLSTVNLRTVWHSYGYKGMQVQAASTACLYVHCTKTFICNCCSGTNQAHIETGETSTGLAVCAATHLQVVPQRYADTAERYLVKGDAVRLKQCHL